MCLIADEPEGATGGDGEVLVKIGEVDIPPSMEPYVKSMYKLHFSVFYPTYVPTLTVA